jgi:hypothetical protein
MNPGLIDRIETNMERLASALFGAAAGYVAYSGLEGLVALPELAVCAGAAAIVANLVCCWILHALAHNGPQFSVRAFDVREIEAIEDELLLTDVDRAEPAELVLTDAERLDPHSSEPLELEDVLAELRPDSRVVRLFDRRAMPTPGQLKSRIDHHLSQESSPAAQSDASQALSDALAELRRSLR